MSKLRVGVVGAGHLGRIHARLLAAMPEVQLVAVADPVLEAREAVAEESHTMAVADYTKLLGRIDAAVVATPTSLHHAIACELLRCGVPVLVEKPLAATVAQAQEIVALARKHRLPVQVGHVERFNPALTAALPHLEGPRYLESVRAGAFTFRSVDVGVVLDLMIHDIDIVLSLVDSPVSRVEAIGLAVLGQHEDVAQARLEFANGCVANLSASRISHVQRRQLHGWAERALVAVDMANRAATVTEPSSQVLQHAVDVERMNPAERLHYKDHLMNEHLPQRALDVEARNALGDELANFLAAVRGHETLRVPAEDGLAALEIAHRILEQIELHVWEAATDGPVGRLGASAPSILRGPHWSHVQRPARREAV